MSYHLREFKKTNYCFGVFLFVTKGIDKTSMAIKPECVSKTYEGLNVGCSNAHEMEFKSPCTEQSISGKWCVMACLWRENLKN